MHVDDLKPEIGDPLQEPDEGRLIWHLGAKGCRARADGDRAVFEFHAQQDARLAGESDLIRLRFHQDYRPVCDLTTRTTPRSRLIRACSQRDSRPEVASSSPVG